MGLAYDLTWPQSFSDRVIGYLNFSSIYNQPIKYLAKEYVKISRPIIFITYQA